MKNRWFVAGLLLAAAALACGPAQNNSAATALARAALTAQAAQTATVAQTAAPGPTPGATDTPPPSDTPLPSATPAATAAATATTTATAAASATPPATAAATATASALPPTAGPSFLTTVIAVKRQVDGIGGEIDFALAAGARSLANERQACATGVASYNFVAARATLPNVPAALAGAYSLYTQGVSIFLTQGAGMYQNCNTFLDNQNKGGVSPLQWAVTRTAVTKASQLLRQAIIAAGGTP